MRSFLLVAFLVFVLLVAVLYVFRKPIRERFMPSRPPAEAPEAPSDPGPGLPDVARRVRSIQLAPETQRILADFVRDCAKRGPAAVAELRRKLLDEPDVDLQQRWTFEDGRMRGFPTLRSAYIAALLAIPGPEARDALLEALAATSSADEAFQIVAGLDRRGEGGFTAAAFDRATRAGPGDAEVAGKLVELLAHVDPEGAAAEVTLRSPRGEDGADPTVLADVLGMLPVERALATARTLLVAPEVTPKAKKRYLQSLCDRGEPEVFASLADVAREAALDRELRVTMAYAAVGSRAFYLDQGEYAAAGAGSEGTPRAAILERYMRRIEAVEALVDAVVPPDPSTETVRESLLRRLAEQRSRLK